MADRHITTSSGLRLGLNAYGDPAVKRLVVMFHPMPGSAGFDPNPTVTRHWGVHLLAADRPGYGASDPLPEGELASFARHADDIAAHIGHLEEMAQDLAGTDLGRVGVVGWGVGAHPAASLAARHPGLVDRLVLLDAPIGAHAPQLDAPFSPRDLCVSPRDPTLTAWPATNRRLGHMLAAAQTQGNAGVDFDRMALKNADWKERLRDIRAETLLVYGAGHPRVSARTDGRSLHRKIRGSRLVGVKDASALSISAVWSRILAHVAPHPSGV